ncbi:Cytochrome c oxidase assembly protein cox19, variant 2 [Basidiobolus ranarum]|uniref:Cytochrome c oxidase assembly protein COX19 n=1 Tax=Basidiobolus ranarum TaxID=34480 RepID=A0ABR2W1W3_9FUNG
MSFGGPPNTFSFNASPPDRGSFPLDHEGECKEAMMEYMECLKQNKAVNGACRDLSKAYLKCRMERFIQYSTLTLFSTQLTLLVTGI